MSRTYHVRITTKEWEPDPKRVHVLLGEYRRKWRGVVFDAEYDIWFERRDLLQARLTVTQLIENALGRVRELRDEADYLADLQGEYVIKIDDEFQLVEFENEGR